MKLSSSPSQISLNFLPFSFVTVRAMPQANWLMIQSGFDFSTMASVTK